MTVTRTEKEGGTTEALYNKALKVKSMTAHITWVKDELQMRYDVQKGPQG